VSSDDLDLLVHRYFERTLPPDEESRLWERIATDPAAADRFVELCELESALVESLKAEEEMPSGVQAIVRRSRRRIHPVSAPAGRAAWPIVAAAALFLVLLSYLAMRPEPRTVARAPQPAVEGAPVREDLQAEWRRAEQRLVEIQKERVRLEEARKQAPADQAPEVRRDVEDRLAKIETEQKEATTDLQRAKDELARESVTAIAPKKAAVVVVESAEGEIVPRVGELAEGQGLETRGARSLAVLRFEDGTRVELKRDSRVENVQQKNLVVARGTVAASVAKQRPGRPMTFLTSQAEVTVIGTRLAITVGADSTRVDVEEGRVRVKRLPDGASVELAAGRTAVAAKGVPLVSKPIVQTVAFQDGVSPTVDYAGTRDTSISSSSPTSTSGSMIQLRSHKNNETENTVLVRWDVSSIPPGSRVVSAEVSLWITGGLAGPARRLHEVRHPWEEADATWRTAGRVAWQVAGAQGDGDRGKVALGELAPASNGFSAFPLNDSGVALVQGWINAPGRNFGIAIASASTNAWDLDSREGVTSERRPRLTVSFIPGAGK